MRKTQGFTLLEILLVVGIISLLAGIVIIAINPSKQLATTRDMQRKHDIGEINKAITQYYIDHNGYPAVLSAALTPICNSGTDTSPSCSAGTLDLSALIPDYLTAIPYDPSASTATTTGYSLATNTGGNLYLSAANAELATITLGSSAGVTGAEVGGGEESTCDATCQSLRSGLVAYWPFDSDYNDAIGSSDFSGSASLVSGAVGQAVSLNNAVMTLPEYIDFPSTGTICFWVKNMDDTQNGGYFAPFHNTNDSDYYNPIFSLNDAAVFIRDYPFSGQSAISIDYSLFDETFGYLCMVQTDNSQTDVYVNGSYVDSSYLADTGGIYNMGESADYQVIDEVAIWSRALDGIDIQNLYNLGEGISLVQ